MAATSDQTRRVRATALIRSGRETEPAGEIAAPTQTRTPACTEPTDWLTRVRIEARAVTTSVWNQEAAKSGLDRVGLLIEADKRMAGDGVQPMASRQTDGVGSGVTR